MALEAAIMAEAGKSAQEIIEAMEDLKDRTHTSFIVDNLDFLARAGQIGHKIADITKALMIRPVLILKTERYLMSRRWAIR